MIDTTGCTPEMKKVIESFNESLERLDELERLFNLPNVSKIDIDEYLKSHNYCDDDCDDDCDDEDDEFDDDYDD